MAGLRDYKEYMPQQQDEESPFWERPATRRRPQRPDELSVSAPSAGRPLEEDPVEQYLLLAAGLWGVVCEHVLVHPCQVLRRQCQVNGQARRYHLTPLTLPGVVYALHRHQGAGVLWKGLGSALMVRGLRLAAEDVVGKLSDCPRELTADLTASQLQRHLAMKLAAGVLSWPFSAASLTESVQSEVACERAGALDVLTEGVQRALAGLAGSRHGGRLLPGWRLAPVCALHGFTVYLTALVCGELVARLLRCRAGETARRDPVTSCLLQLQAAAAGRYVAEALFYPVDSVLTRLQVQGTRAIVDSLDTGESVLPVSSRYDGLLDCWHAVQQEEGLAGLYRGFGALLWQAGIHLASLYACHLLLQKVRALTSNPPPPPRRLTSPHLPVDSPRQLVEERPWSDMYDPTPQQQQQLFEQQYSSDYQL